MIQVGFKDSITVCTLDGQEWSCPTNEEFADRLNLEVQELLEETGGYLPVDLGDPEVYLAEKAIELHGGEVLEEALSAGDPRSAVY